MLYRTVKETEKEPCGVCGKDTVRFVYMTPICPHCYPAIYTMTHGSFLKNVEQMKQETENPHPEYDEVKTAGG